MVMNKMDTNIKTVKVNRTKLLSTLETNLTTHREVFKEAIAGYRDAKTTKLQQLNEATNAAVANGTDENRRLVHEAYNEFAHLERPQDHSESYELAIEIMKWETSDEVELSINDFQCYVRDKWNWKNAFRNSVLNYANAHSHKV